MATWVHQGSQLGEQPLDDTSTVQIGKLGRIVQGFSTTYGQGEFIYLKGVASTAIGDLVTYDVLNATTTRTVASSRGPVAIALSANVANQYGWYQIAGSNYVKAGTVASGAVVYVTATAGQIDDAVVSGDKVDGMRTTSADGTPSAGFCQVRFNRPALSGNG